MDNLRYGKWAAWIALSLLSMVVNVISQTGFLSLNCGGQTNTTTQNGITWISDANYIDMGNTTDIDPDASAKHNESLYGFSLYSLRFFPNPLKKSCYHLPVVPDVPYLLRLTFALGNYSGTEDQQSPITFGFSIETLGLVFPYFDLEFTDATPYSYEYVLVSSGSVLYVCLMRTSTYNPFINAIELRTLRQSMYQAVKPGTILRSMQRYNFGGNSPLIRYPDDKFDRHWSLPPKISSALAISTRHLISVNNTEDFPPSAMMQTAWVVNSSQIERFHFSLASYTGKTLVVLYFAEIETPNPPESESRSFDVKINGIKRSSNITLVRNYSAIGLTFVSSNYFSFDIVKATKSTLGPIINGYEYNRLYDTQQVTSSQDVEALNAIKNKFHVKKNWISDPCFWSDWEGIGCDNTSYLSTRIQEMNLSGWNLTGSIPEHIGQLTSLVNLSLDNNRLVGSLPNFSNLTMLERLYLHNNNLSGSLPEWLSELKNLKELFIENNSFSGVIPAQLFNEFLNNSLKLNYSGNHQLFNPLPRSKKSKVGVVLGITLSGILIIAVATIVGTVFYRKKFSRKEGVPISVMDTVTDAEYSPVMMPSPTKSRAFTRKEISAATRNFSTKIGRGGFGWVFLGQLPEGKEIAVKVLSLVSTQGVQEFLNEVDLLSRIHHRNLVSLLGYCNEYKEHMVIYEYMCGGCFRDHLYGKLFSTLSWTKRVKIALDAAQGLEYLHVGCTPKIIHRDVKTANILLDNNLNGKLSDFGLSRMTLDEDASHVTTVVKGTFGYFDPEYFNTQNLTEKSDVYSFGVVLFEIICGRQPIDINLPEEQVNLVRWVTPYVEMDENNGKIENIIDKALGYNYDMKSITRVAKLAIRCVQAQPSSRPNISEVVAELKEATKHDNDALEDIDADYIYLGMQSSGPKEMMCSDDNDNIFGEQGN